MKLGYVPAALLLAVLLGLNQTHLSPEDAADYHERVSDAAARIPYQVGPWKGKDQEVPPAAIELLRPNVMISRTYVHEVTGQSVSVLVIQCKDARDLLGHYPPVCYPAQGWRIYETIQGVGLNGEKASAPTGSDHWALYRMEHGKSERFAGGRDVYQKMLLPTGVQTLSMQEVQDFAGNYQLRHYGAGQVQVVMNSAGSESTRDMDLLVDSLTAFEQTLGRSDQK